jgi:hypothetical protein
MKLYDVITTERESKGRKKPIVEEISEPEFVLPKEPAKFSWKRLSIVGGSIIFLAVLYIAGMKLVHARVVIHERHIPFSLSDTELELTHEKDASSGRLSFQTMVVSTTVTREVFGSELSASASKAKGQAVIFNEYSKTAQSVKAGTVLTAANGKKYVTNSTVSVPGFTQSGTKKTPGTATVSITASATGPDYNATSASFTVAGWSGAKAKQFYARSAGAITGGDAGMKHALSATEKANALATLQAQLIERLRRESRAQIPDDLVTFPDLQVATIDPDSFVSNGDGVKFGASLKGSMTSYLIPRDLLEQAIASRVSAGAHYPDVNIPALGDITATPVSPLPTDPNSVPESIIISLSGEGTIIAKAPLETIRESLIGVKRGAFDATLAGVSEIDTATYVLYPFWAPYFPADRNKITVELK